MLFVLLILHTLPSKEYEEKLKIVSKQLDTLYAEENKIVQEIWNRCAEDNHCSIASREFNNEIEQKTAPLKQEAEILKLEVSILKQKIAEARINEIKI